MQTSTRTSLRKCSPVDRYTNTTYSGGKFDGRRDQFDGSRGRGGADNNQLGYHGHICCTTCGQFEHRPERPGVPNYCGRGAHAFVEGNSEYADDESDNDSVNESVDELGNLSYVYSDDEDPAICVLESDGEYIDDDSDDSDDSDDPSEFSKSEFDNDTDESYNNSDESDESDSVDEAVESDESDESSDNMEEDSSDYSNSNDSGDDEVVDVVESFEYSHRPTHSTYSTDDKLTRDIDILDHHIKYIIAKRNYKQMKQIYRNKKRTV